MAPSRKQSNGRSPLVKPQRQITTFFSKLSPPSTSPYPQTFSKTRTPKISNPNPSSPDPSPTTPSPIQSKPKKPLLVIGEASPSQSPSPQTPAAGRRRGVHGKEVVGKRIRVYWPLDRRWYEGLVKSYDEGSGKHLVRYDDSEEEVLDLGEEKVEWVEESVRKFKRLRKACFSFKNTVVEDTDTDSGGGDNDDNSSDEDWGKNVKDISEEENGGVDLEDETVEELDVKGKGGRKGESKKRKVSEAGWTLLSSAKKSKSSGDTSNGKPEALVVESTTNRENEVPAGLTDKVIMDSSETFIARDDEKLWFLGEKRRDAQRRRPGEVGYDPKTLYLPLEFLKGLSGGQRQWWEFKSKHMDKVLFFKMGKFYELFEMDAHVGAKELNLQYMKGEQPHCGFPERNFSVNVEKLAIKGYRVLVIEQTETPEQLELRRKEKGSKDKVVKREICAVVTKGTLTDGELLSANPDASYLMAVTESCQTSSNKSYERVVGVCVVDVATSRIFLGQFGDDEECSSLCCLLSELRPVEIVKPEKLLSLETERAILRHTRNPLVNELVPLSEFWDAEKTVRELKTIYKSIQDQSAAGSPDGPDSEIIGLEDAENGASHLPDILQELIKKGENGSQALSALGGILYYLKQAFLDETLLRFGKFESLPCSDFFHVAQKPYMVLDAAALENLEIFENSRNGGSTGTLYAQLNHCVTPFGKRMLKSWLARPLYHLESIKARQDAIEGLLGTNQPLALEFRKAVSRLPDMERLLVRIFSCSEANGRNANKVVLYEDAAKKQLQEFISALRGCESMVQACSSLSAILEVAKSKQLHYLLTPGKGLPEVHLILKHFKEAFDWVEANSTRRIIPLEGVDTDYDSACRMVKEVESGLAKHLKEQKKLLGEASISYVTIGKEAYLLEIPEQLRGSIPWDYELRSSRKGFYRYWNPSIKRFLGDLSQAESQKESTLKSILQRLISRFCEHHEKWRQLVSATAELDVLISLRISSDLYEGPSCCPNIIGPSLSTEFPRLSAKSLGHPVLRSDSLGKGSFVPNDISIGGSDHANFILLTGPNMGGKSTLLRQVCLAAILAQVGANVPAESFELSPVDRIYVRMGAKDHIMAGQSTFLTELSETALMLSSATHNSLVALDELGRGTSTSDGQAIADAVLGHFVHEVQCRGMFSTHYHRLAVDYQEDPKVSLCHMACQVGSRAGEVEEVTFLYRLAPGACPKSYGVNVARLAGLPDSVLHQAAAKSREFEHEYGNCRKGSKEISDTQNSGDDMSILIQDLINVTNSNCSESCKGIGISSFTELQQRARKLLQRC